MLCLGYDETMKRKPLTLLLLTFFGPSIGPALAATAPLRFLTIPIRGTIGVDVTPSGVQQAIALALHEQYDGISFEFDARVGDLNAGVAIAGLVKQANERTRTIALLTRVGGPALPILAACEDWFILSTAGEVGEASLVMQTLPSRAPTAEAMTAHLSALTHACMKNLATGPNATARKKIFQSLATPNAGLSGTALVDAKVARVVGAGLQALRIALDVDTLEAQGDSGLVLVGDAANEQFDARRRVGSLIDNAFASIDAIDSLTSAMAWTFVRAELSNPMSPARLWRYPMAATDGAWVMSPDDITAFTRATNDAVRRWSGVVELSSELTKLNARAADMLTRLQAIQVDPLDRERWTAAVNLLTTLLPDRHANLQEMNAKGEHAKATIESLEGSLEALDALTR